MSTAAKRQLKLGGLILALCAGVGITALLGESRIASASGVTALDGNPWRWVQAEINNTLDSALPCFGEIHYEFDSSGGSLTTSWWNDDLELDDGHFQESAAFRGTGTYTSLDLTEIAAAGLSPGSIDGVLECAAAPGVTIKFAFGVASVGGVETATLTSIYQSATYTVPGGAVYGIRPAGQGAGAAIYTPPVGGRTVNMLKLQR